MFREFVSISSSTSNKASASKDINPSSSSIHARLRSSKQQQLRESETLTVIPPSSGQSPNQTQSSPAGVPRAVSKTSARMTRKRAAHLVHLEETASHKAEEGSTHTCDGSGGSVESISQICLCQPDPKIPRPRNGMFKEHHS
jgi:HMG box factor